MLAAFILLVLVKEPEKHKEGKLISPLRRKNLALLGKLYWQVVLIGILFNLARFSGAFLLLRVQNLGLQAAMVPLILVVMNIACSLTAFPVGKLSDKIGRKGLMASGLMVLITADVLLGSANTPAGGGAGAGLWGQHLGLTQGILTAWIADAAHPELRGTAFGFFGLFSGIAILLASVLAGWLWQEFSPSLTFFSGALIAILSLFGFMLVGKERAVKN